MRGRRRYGVIAGTAGGALKFQWSPAKLTGLSFLGLIAAGTFFLFLPAATSGLAPARFIDALFTATSAVCVTGLIVQDTPVYFSTFGQIIILCLIQLGGLGIMTLSAALPVLFGRGLKMAQRGLFQGLLEQSDYANLRSTLKSIVLYTLAIEAAGAALLSLRFYFLWDDWKKAVYFGVFHAVSAFCNAGFALFSDNLVSFRGDVLVNAVVMGLIILGGLGFVVLREVYGTRGRRSARRLSLHARLVLSATALFICLPAFFIFFAEYSGSFLNLPLSEKILASFFQSVTARTAGFNTVDLAELGSATVFLTCILMFVGAAPGGTGGGVKVSTVSLLILSIRSLFLQRDHIEVSGRRISAELVTKAIAILAISFSLVTVFIMVMALSENFSFEKTYFEVISAFGTVGLSLGITQDLSDFGKLVISTVMFIGRIGPLTLVFLLGTGRKKVYYRLPEGRVIVG